MANLRITIDYYERNTAGESKKCPTSKCLISYFDYLESTVSYFSFYIVYEILLIIVSRCVYFKRFHHLEYCELMPQILEGHIVLSTQISIYSMFLFQS